MWSSATAMTMIILGLESSAAAGLQELATGQAEHVLTALETLGASVTATRDESRPDRPIVGLKVRRGSGIGDAVLEQLAGLTELRTLELDGSGSYEGARLDASLVLKTAEQRRAILTDAGLAALARLDRLETLRFWRYPLDRGNRSTSEGLTRLFDALGELRALDIKGIPLGGARLRSLTHLRTLRLVNAFSGLSGGSGALADLRAMPDLTTLDLSHNGITALGFLQGLTSLRELRLAGNPIGDQQLVHLMELTDLKRLDLGTTQVSASGVQGLRRALPGADIRH
jgi:hypothetical protein